MKNKKYISKIIIIMTILIMCYTIPATASNYKDTTFKFYFRNNYTDMPTAFREKQDDTSAYMKCEATSYSYTAFVVGSRDLFDVYYDMSGGHQYTFNTGTVHKMINYVYENKLAYAAIYAKRNYSYNYYASGLWSPDSV